MVELGGALPHESKLTVCVRDTEQYRKLAKDVTTEDSARNVLEIGCSYGHCTALLAKAKSLVAIDVSAECIEVQSDTKQHTNAHCKRV